MRSRAAASQPISGLPWQVSRAEFVAAAHEVETGGACCMFVIDASIPQAARSGYAALVIAYARAEEPVCIFSDGSAALLIRDGGVDSAQVVARRIFDQMKRLGLEGTMRAGIAALGAEPAAMLETARAAAEGAEAGGTAVAA
ncbi:MAG: hypothetical protein JOZ75_00700 [Candidatus Dormibacteraeota bacterium]|nr:hypothetical protein [Candidatus Dormibacteraeota bacterium]